VVEVLSPEEEAKRLAKREKLVREMVETEKSYVSQLDALDECYMTPLLKEATKPEPPLSLKQCDALFLNVRSIKSMNETTLLAALEKSLTTANQCIGQALIDFAPFFQFYKDYIANHVKANDLLEQLNAGIVLATFPHMSPFVTYLPHCIGVHVIIEDSPYIKFKAFCAAALADPKAKNLSLASLLITPIQRVPRYKMLLDEIRKNTPHTHADTAALDKAYALVSQAAIDINEAVRSQENRTFLMDMQENLFTSKMTLVKPGPMTADRYSLLSPCHISLSLLTRRRCNCIIAYLFVKVY
jgi:FYVE/RhoGEF/PH domain-containing protein 3